MLNEAIFVASLKYIINKNNVIKLALWVYYTILPNYINKIKSFIDLDTTSIKIIAENADISLIQEYLDMYATESIYYDADIVKLFWKWGNYLDTTLITKRTIIENDIETFMMLNKIINDADDMFLFACKNNSRAIAKYLLTEVSLKCRKTDGPILVAIEANSHLIVKMLLNRHFFVTVQCLEYAIYMKNIDIVRLILQTNYKFKININGSFGGVLIFIINNDMYQIMELLIFYFKTKLNRYRMVDICSKLDKYLFVKMFLENGGSMSKEALLYASMNKNYKMLTLLKQYIK